MKQKKIVVFGIGDFADQVSYYLRNDSKYDIVAYTVDGEYIQKESFLSRPLVDFKVIQDKYPPKQFGMFIAIGYNKLNTVREIKFHEAKSKGYNLVSYLCSRNTFWDDLELGENCFIMEGNIFQMSVKISDNVIMGIGNRIAHNTRIKENCFLAGNVTVGGFCTIKKNSFLGLGSVIRDKTIVEEHCIIGAGSVILKKTEKNMAYISSSTPRSVGNSDLIMNFL